MSITWSGQRMGVFTCFQFSSNWSCSLLPHMTFYWYHFQTSVIGFLPPADTAIFNWTYLSLQNSFRTSERRKSAVINCRIAWMTSPSLDKCSCRWLTVHCDWANAPRTYKNIINQTHAIKKKKQLRNKTQKNFKFIIQ